MPNNTFLRSPLDIQAEQWKREGGLPPLPVLEQPQMPAPRRRAAMQGLPNIEDLQRELDRVAPGRFRVVTGEELAQFQGDTPQAEAPDAAAIPGATPMGTTPEEVGFWDRIAQVAKSGWQNMTRALDVSRAVLSDDFSPQTVDLIANIIEQQIKEAQDDKGRQHESERALKDAIEQFGKTEGAWDTTTGLFSLLGTVFANPKGVAIGTVEQLANMLPSMGGALAGAGTGAAVGAGVGSIVPGAGTAAGAATGALWGSRAGLAAGTAVLEFGNEITEAITSRLEEQGKKPTKENIAALLSDPKVQDEIKTQAEKKGLTLAAVDALTMGIAGKIGARGVEAAKAGRRGAAAGYGAGAFGVELVGESAGEAASQLVARGEIDKADVAAEGIFGAGAAVGHAAVGTAGHAIRDRVAGRRAPGETPPGVGSPAAPSGTTPSGTTQAPQSRAVWRTQGQEIPVEIVNTDVRLIGDDRAYAHVRMGENETLVPMDELAPAVEPAPSGPVGRAVQDAMRQAAVAEAVAPIGLADAGAVAATPGVDAVGRAVPATSGERSGIDLPSTDVAADSLPALSPGLVLRGDGTPFKTEKTARQAMMNRRLQGYEPVQVEGGWALAPIGAAPLSTTQGEAYAAQEGEIAQGDQLEHPQADQGRGAAAAASGGDSVEARGQEPGASQEVSQEADTAPAKPPRAAQRASEPREETEEKTAVTEPSDGDVPYFETYDDANDWIERRAKALGMSRRAFSSTDEYKAVYPQIEALYQDQKAKTAKQRMAALRDAGLAVGDRVKTTVMGMFLNGEDYYGTIVLWGGEPWVKVDGKITVSKKGRLYEASRVRWTPRWKKVTATAGAPAGAQQSMEVQDGLQEGRQEAQVSEPALGEPALVYRSDGSPFKTAQAARLAAKNRRLQGYEPVEVEGGWALRPTEQPTVEPTNSLGRTASWVIREKDTGRVVMETSDRAKVEALNTEKYEAVPAQQHLAELNDPESKAGRAARQESAQSAKRGAEERTQKGEESTKQQVARTEQKAPQDEERQERQAEQAAAAEQSESNKPAAKPKRKPQASKNTIFTDEAAEKARQVLRSKLGQLNSGIDPEIMQAGITLAGYHIERGARTFAAYAKAMIEDMGEAVRPYLKSWYLGVRFDPRAAEFADDMDSAAAVESFDLDRLDEEPSTTEREGAERSEPELTETVVTPSGRELEVRFKVVEADNLITSNDLTGRVNPDYPAELQPRDRSRATSQAQITEIAANINPRLLGSSPSATDGAPIVGPDNVVESGNGRTLALRLAYERGLESAEKYRRWLAEQGYNVEGMRAPVLVRERVTELTPEERQVFTVEANERTTLEMSATERAMADAQRVGEIIHLYRGGDVDAAANRDFVRAFADRVVSPSDRGRFIDRNGAVSVDGIRRMQAALVAHAYGDESLVATLFETTDNDIRAIGGALLDVSPAWAQMRQESREGVISPLVDVTPNLLEAVRIIRRARSEGRPVNELANQNDMFSGSLPPTTLMLLGVFYRGENFARPRSRERVTDLLRYYIDQARATQPGEDMFGAPPVSGEEIARRTYERAQSEDRFEGQQSDFFSGRGAAGEDTRAGGQAGQRSGGGEARAEGPGVREAQGEVDVSSTGESLERDRGEREAGEPVIRASNEDERRADTASPGRAGEGAGGARRAGQRDRGVSEAGAAARGERSNQPVHQQDGEYESSRGAARDTERGGSRRDSDTGSAVEQERAEDIARHAQTPRTGDFAERLAKQREAQNVPTVWGDKESIDAALPLLLPEQREDVLKAEQRFANHNGMLFTNATGTGKTFTGLGIAKRFYNDGKRNILVVVPSDKVASDWVESAAYLVLPLKQLEHTADNGGSGPVVTTYANFGQNPTLADREWDLVIADESHYLMSSEDAEVTRALDMLRALTGHPEGFYPYLKAKYRDLYQQVQAARRDLSDANANPDIPQDEYARRQARANQLNAQWAELENRERAIWQQRWVEQRDLPRVTFLSATPFAYVKNVEYAEGYLFNYAPPAERFNMRSRGYGEGGPREQFFVQNFGYRMRYNRLTEPEAGVNVELLEQEFHERLKREGALSGRRLEVPYDYERRFLLVEDAVGTKIDEGLKWLHDYDDGRFRPLYDYVKEQFTYHQQMFLLEAIKAKHAIPHIKKHLALGRKVVVFHDFNQGGGFHPFNIPKRPGIEISYLVRGKSVLVRWDDLVQAFRNLRPDLANMDMRDLYSPIEAMRRAFPDALFFNGTISKAERRKNANLFNDDNSGRNLIVVQSDAGREGISLHDTTGKHQRVLINLGIPVKPVAATQIEGRIYRTGQASNAIFDYMTTGTAWEAYAFGTKIAERASTAENLALGYEARGLRRAFIDAYQNARFFEPSKNDGVGGKAYDRTMGVSAPSSDFERAKTYYWAQQKNTKSRDQREGVDYYATPEPVGLKMVQWADIRPNESVLEPSAGHGAIARFVPDNARLTMVEPSYDLAQRAALARGDARIVNERFEDLHINNKYNAIVMNPPYGTGGKTAIEHLAKAAKHLKNNGRIVALLPRGGMADQRFNQFMGSDEAKGLYQVAEILLPPSTFERAGTKVNTKIVILERQDNPDVAATLEQHHIDLSNVETVEELFDRIEHIEMPARAAVEATPEPEIVEHITQKGKRLRGVIRTDLTKEQAQSIDPYTFRKKNEAGETGWFIRERHLEELNARFPLRFSISEVGTRTSADLLVELRAGPLGSIIDRLLANNSVMLHDTVREFAVPIPQGAQGFTENGVIHLIAENLRPGTASAVLLHEAFHNGAQSLLGDAEWKRLQKRLAALYRQAQRSEGKLNEFWRQAHARVEHAQRMGDRMSEAIAIEEFGAYAIENYELAPRSIRKWVDDLIGAIKAWLVRRFGVQLGDVTPAQLRALALAALRASAERPAVNIPRRPLGGVALNAAPLSVADIPETIEVDGVERPTRNSNGQPIAATEEGIRNFWRWFGSSRVVDDQGRPLVVYHGVKDADMRVENGAVVFTPKFDVFDTKGRTEPGAWFSPDPKVAAKYGTPIPFYLKAVAPAREEGPLTAAPENADAVYRMRGKGDSIAQAWEIAVFRPGQIKLATGNRGTFDGSNPDISFSLSPEQREREGVALSVAALPDTITVDGKQRPTRNSNGQPLGRTEEEVRNFWRWFGSSRVVDDQGRPLVVYHGTRTKGEAIDSFDIEKAGSKTDSGWMGKGFYFGGQRTADAYAGHYEFDPGHYPEGGAVYPVYLSIQNPAILKDSERNDGPRTMVRELLDLADDASASEVRDGLLAAGYDGVIYERFSPYGNGYREYVAFHPEQIKSATGNVGTFDPANPDIRYSIKPSEHFDDLTDEQKRFLDKIGPERLPRRLADRWRQLTDNLGLRIRQAGVDRYAALLRNDQAIYGEDTLEGSIASSSWVLARMSHSAGGGLTAMLRYGRIYLDPKEKVIDVLEGTEGLMSVFQDLGTPQELDRFMAWIAANRAKKLLGEGRENLFTLDEVEAGIKLSAGKLADGRARPVVYQQTWEKFKQYLDDVLGIAEQGGIITPEQRQMWMEEFYVPFYRVLDDDTIGGPSSSSGLSRQQAYKRLKGGKQNLNDLLENTLMNFHHLIQASLKNQAAQQAVENAMELGIAEPTTEAERDKKASTWIMVNGEKRWYNIHDPLTFKAISALAHPGYNHPLMKAGRAFKRLYTKMTTSTPQFVIANTLRDSLSAMATSPTSGVPFKNALKGAAVYGNEYNRARMIASGGAFSFGYVYGQNADEIKASLKGTLRRGRLLSDPVLIPGALLNAWRKWEDVTNFAENVNRAGIWERNLEKGKLKAAFEARDLMDFSAHGDALIVRLIADLSPFTNARFQGLDKLYRSGIKPGVKVLTGKGNKADRKNFARFAAVTGALAMLSMLLYLRNWDDEEYRKLEDWQRDTYWVVRIGNNMFFIPKPFEVGAIATLAERALEQFMDPTVAGRKFGERLWAILTDTFALDLPQMIKPPYELAVNRDTFTDRPIEDQSMRRLSPSLRVRPTTTRLAEWTSQTMESALGLVGAENAALSPVQIDHLIAGYLGQVGAGVAATADVIWRRAWGEEMPYRHWYEYQPIRRFYRNLELPAPYTRYTTDFYNALKEVDQAYANIQHLKKYKEFKRAAELQQKEADKLALRKWLNRIQRDLAKINSEMRKVQMDKSMSGEEKRYRLDRLRERKNMITEQVGKELERRRAMSAESSARP